MRYEVLGDTMPAVEVLFDAPGESMYTQSGGMTWMSEHISMETNMKGGLFKGIGRMFAGESLFMATYTAQRPGEEITLASSFPGEIRIIEVGPGKEYIAQKNAFLCATPNVTLSAYVTGVKSGLFGGEGMTESMRDEMHRVWGKSFLCTQNYGMSELCGPGVSGECEYLQGMHVNEDWFIPEIIAPETGEVLPPGSKGELVITCLGKEALPLVRYRTKDISRLMYEPCPCGRTTVRMENLSGRSDDMLVIRGVNVFPTQIEEVLLQITEIGPHYEIKVERRNRLDVMTITVELIDDRRLDSYRQLEDLNAKIRKNLKATLGLDAVIQIVAPMSLQRFEGKAKRVTDLRGEGL